MLDIQGKREDYLFLVEFSYNNNYQSTIKMAHFELLYKRLCRTPLCWNKLDEVLSRGSKLIQENIEKMRKIQEHIKAA